MEGATAEERGSLMLPLVDAGAAARAEVDVDVDDATSAVVDATGGLELTAAGIIVAPGLKIRHGVLRKVETDKGENEDQVE